MIAQLEPISRSLGFAQTRFTYGLQKTAEADKLSFSVGGSAKTPLQIAGAYAGMIGFIAGAVATGQMERPSGFPEPPTSGEAAIAGVNAAFEKLQGVIAGLTEADLAKTLRAPWGQELPISDWLVFINQVAGYWQGQLNITQMAYGDEDPNIPPQFGGH